jgi:hypothetical protein
MWRRCKMMEKLEEIVGRVHGRGTDYTVMIVYGGPELAYFDETMR